MGLKVLIVDDDEVTRKLLREVLLKQGYEIELAASGEDAVKAIRKTLFPIILCDIRMLEVDGMKVLQTVKQAQLRSAVILMTGFGSMEGAIEAIQEGAFDYVSKPFRMDHLKAVVSRAAKHWEALRDFREQTVSRWNPSVKSLIGQSRLMVEVYKLLARAAMSSSCVLILGEKGTGKELVARSIHEHSSRKNKGLLVVNCGAFSEVALESELFGHCRGAFEGASAEKKGLFEEGSGGTLFLEDLGRLSPSLQVKLLRVLEENRIKPMGSQESRPVNMRVIGATDEDLDALVRAGKFREDLYYRLKVISIELPALRDRLEDLPSLIEYFLSKYAQENRKTISHLSDEAMQILKAYDWPGNIRELEHVIERSVAMSSASILFPEDFPSVLFQRGFSERGSDCGEGGPLTADGVSLEELEKKHIIRTLKDVHFNKSKASEILGIDRATLYRKAQRYGIDLTGRLFDPTSSHA